jgi:hypothetical protein
MAKMNDEQLYDKIEAYLKGALSEEERAAVEREIQNNPEAALELQLQQVELDAMEVLLERDLRGKVNQWLDEDEPPPSGGGNNPPAPPASRSGRLWIAVLLGAFVVLAIVIWRMDWSDSAGELTPAKETPLPTGPEQPPPPSGPIAAQEEPAPAERPQETQKTRPSQDRPPADNGMIALAGSFYEELSFGNVRKGATGAEGAYPLAEAERAFAEKRFQQAKDLAAAVPASSSYAVSALELIAHASYKLKDYAESAAAFAEVAATGLPPYAERAQWNQLLCYLAQYPADQDAFDAVLAELLEDKGHAYHKKARELQEKLPR